MKYFISSLKSLGAILILFMFCSIQSFAQKTVNAQKEYEKNLKNSLLQDIVNIATGNDVSTDYQNPKSFLPGGGISGSVCLKNWKMIDFVGVNYIGLNGEGQTNNKDGIPLVWFYENYSWQWAPLTDVVMITYNSFEYINARNYNLNVSVSLKNGNVYNYSINPARNTIKVFIKSGANNAIEEPIQVFNPAELLIGSIIFY